jgi:hypothetical protein
MRSEWLLMKQENRTEIEVGICWTKLRVVWPWLSDCQRTAGNKSLPSGGLLQANFTIPGSLALLRVFCHSVSCSLCNLLSSTHPVSNSISGCMRAFFWEAHLLGPLAGGSAFPSHHKRGDAGVDNNLAFAHD